MIKAISYWMLKDSPPMEVALNTVKNAGFEGLELSIGQKGHLTHESSEKDCLKIRRQILESGVIVETAASASSWTLNLVSNDPAVRSEAIAFHSAALQRAAWCGVRALMMHSGVVYTPIFSKDIVRYDYAITRCQDAINQLLDIAEKVNVDLCLENVWNGMFYSPLELINFIDSFKSKRLGVYFDPGNCQRIQQHPPHMIELLGKRIKRVHMSDYKENFGLLTSSIFKCHLGEGDVPWEDTLSALRKIEYDSTLVAEIFPWSITSIAQASIAMDILMNRAS